MFPNSLDSSLIFFHFLFLYSFFSGFEWDKLKSQSLTAPLVLPVLSNKDLSNFESQDPFYDDPPSENSGWDIGFWDILIEKLLQYIRF